MSDRSGIAWLIDRFIKPICIFPGLSSATVRSSNMKTTLKVVLGLIVIAALALSELTIMFWLGGNDVKKFCHETRPGLPIAQLEVLAKKHDVRYTLSGLREDSGTFQTLVSTPRSFGRHTCLVRHDNISVITSEYFR